MNPEFEKALLDFDTDFFEQNVVTTTQNHPQSLMRLPKDGKKKKSAHAIYYLKSKIIKSDTLIQQFLAKCDSLTQIEEKLEVARKECQQAHMNNRITEMKCEVLEKDCEKLRNENRELEHRAIAVENKQAASVSYTNQLQLLVKERDSQIEGLKRDKIFDKNIVKKLERRIFFLNKHREHLKINLSNVAEVVFTKRTLNKKEKIILSKYMRMKRQRNAKETEITFNEGENGDCDEADQLTDNEEFSEICNDKVFSSSSPEIKSYDTEKKSFECDDCGEDVSVDTGRASSLTIFSDDLSSPGYITNKSASDNIQNRCTNTVATSPITVLQSVDIATSPISFDTTPRSEGQTNNAEMDEKIKKATSSPVKKPTLDKYKSQEIAFDGIEPLSKTPRKTNLELSNINSVDEDVSNNEIETILNSMRLSDRIMTPIPPTPTRILCDLYGHADSNILLQENKSLQAVVETLVKEMTSVKKIINTLTLNNIGVTKEFVENNDKNCSSSDSQANHITRDISEDKFKSSQYLPMQSPKQDEMYIEDSQEVSPHESPNSCLIENLQFGETEELNIVEEDSEIEENTSSQKKIDNNIKFITEEDKKMSKPKKLTRLEKLRQQLLPKNKIKGAVLPSSKKLRSRMKPLPVKKNSKTDKKGSIILNNKDAYEKAVKVMAELRLKQNTFSTNAITQEQNIVSKEKDDIPLTTKVARNTRGSKVKDDIPIAAKIVTRRRARRVSVEKDDTPIEKNNRRKSALRISEEFQRLTEVSKVKNETPVSENFMTRRSAGRISEEKNNKPVVTKGINRKRLRSISKKIDAKPEIEKKNDDIVKQTYLKKNITNKTVNESFKKLPLDTKDKVNQQVKSTEPEIECILAKTRKKYPSLSLEKDIVVVLTRGEVDDRVKAKEFENFKLSPSEVDTSQKGLKNVSLVTPHITNHKRILRSSNMVNTANSNDESKIPDQNSESRNSREAPETRKDNSPLVNYNDLDLFIDEPILNNGSLMVNNDLDNNDEPPSKKKKYTMTQKYSNATQSPSSPSQRFQKSILCKMIEKYGVNTVKKELPQASESVACNIQKYIQENIARIIKLPPKETKKAMMEVIGEMQKWKFIDFISGLMKYLMDPDRKLELYKKEIRPPAPPMTRSEQVLLFFLTRISFKGIDTVQMVFEHIEYALFRLNHAPELEVVESVAHFCAVLCRYTKAKNRLRTFILSAMYSLKFKAIPLIKQCFDVWMHVLPLAHLGIAKSPLVTCIVFLLHYFKCVDRHNRVQEIRNILRKKYYYQITDWNETKILEMFNAAILELKDNAVEMKMLRLALILLAKRHGPNWCHNKIVKGMLLPILNNTQNQEISRAFCAGLVGAVVRPYPQDMRMHSDYAFNYLFEVLKKNLSPTIEEAIYSSFICMRRHNQKRVTEALLLWQPKQISPNMEATIKDYVRRKPIHTWKCLLRNMTSEMC